MVYYLTSTAKYEGICGNLVGESMPVYSSQQERYEVIADWALSKLEGCSRIVLEDYSFGSTGRVFHIAENAGMLKYKLWKKQLPFVTIAPTMIKKYAAGKGNANKETLQDAFFEQTNVDVKGKLGQTEKQWNPSSDIIDSYFMCKYAIDNGEVFNEVYS